MIYPKEILSIAIEALSSKSAMMAAVKTKSKAEKVISATSFMDSFGWKKVPFNVRCFVILDGYDNETFPQCPQCGKPAGLGNNDGKILNTFCSDSCSKKYGRNSEEVKEKLSNHDWLFQMRSIDGRGYEEIGKMIGVSEFCVLRACKKFGLEKNSLIKFEEPKQKLNMQVGYSGYLTESSLYDVLQVLFGSVDKQFSVKIDGRNLRIDFRYFFNGVEHWVEFDGFYHYTDAKTCVRDLQVSEHCLVNKIKLIQIPYFVQLDAAGISHYFGVNSGIDVSVNFPHGFISDGVVYPANFCSLGVSRFKGELTSLPEIIRISIAKNLDELCLKYDPRIIMS